MRRSAAFALLASTSVLTSLTGLARAQSAQEKAAAEALFNEGVKALGEGKFEDACPKLASSEKLDPAIGTALYLGECYEKTSKIASAWAMFHEAADLSKKRGDAKREAIAKERADKLSPSKLTVALAPGADVAGLEVERDGVVVSSTLFGFATPTDGGPHTIRATAPGKKPFERSVDVDPQRANVTVTIPRLEDAGSSPTPSPTTNTAKPPKDAVVATTPTVKPTPTTSAPTTSDAGSGSSQRVAGLVIAGVGVAGVALGSAFGVLAGNDWHSSNTDGQCDANSKLCLTQAGVDSRASAQTEALVSTVGFVAGGVAIVAGAVIFLTARKAPAQTGWLVAPSVDGKGGGGMSLSGSF